MWEGRTAAAVGTAGTSRIGVGANAWTCVGGPFWNYTKHVHIQERTYSVFTGTGAKFSQMGKRTFPQVNVSQRSNVIYRVHLAGRA